MRRINKIDYIEFESIDTSKSSGIHLDFVRIVERIQKKNCLMQNIIWRVYNYYQLEMGKKKYKMK